MQYNSLALKPRFGIVLGLGFLHHAQDELEAIKQTGNVTGYIDDFKCICSKIPSISDDKTLENFICAL